jgi:hypothetical protein
MGKKLKDESKIVGIIYFCDNLKKEIVHKNVDDVTASSQECEICGSHGSISLFIINCECGKSHDIDIKSW